MTGLELDSVVHGYCSDAFGVLGPHQVDDASWEVRAFLPDASDAWVNQAGKLTPMVRLDAEGMFVAKLAAAPGLYLLRRRLYDGAEIQIEDAYRFPPVLTAFDLYLHGEGTNYESYRTMGAHVVEVEGVRGTRFAVWAPNALVVSVVGDFNGWDTRRNPMRARDGGVWEIFIPCLGEGATYKYSVKSRLLGYQVLKADPYALAAELPPKTASIVASLDGYEWGDAAWMEERARKDHLKEPVSVYEVHLGSWLTGPGNQLLSYRELAQTLVPYAVKMNFTHLELMPVMEHPFSGSWGYQVTGYYAPTSRHGAPDDFRYFVDRCHQAGLGVIVDWVPGHFPKDAHGLAFFDGTALYEHADPRMGEQQDWGTLIFNFGRNEVKTFLISNALFWLREYHVDGLRVDAVASMLYLDYSRKAGEWIPNRYGGNENLEAIELLKRVNELAHKEPGAITIAEESTAFSGVSRPVYLNGLGFTMKWNMGWMHDMLRYFSTDAVFRKYHQNDVTFSLLYAFSENFVLPVSHDEVVHGKRSLIDKMPGDGWQKFANVRAFLAYMFGHPGKKLLFMGAEIGQWDEWNHERGLRWDLLENTMHRQLRQFVEDLNLFYRTHPALWEVDFHWSGFEWVDCRDMENSVIVFLRRPQSGNPSLLFCCNFTPVPRTGYRVGVPDAGLWREILNSDSAAYGGSNMGNGGFVLSEPVQHQGHGQSLVVTLPPLAVVVFASPSAERS